MSWSPIHPIVARIGDSPFSRYDVTYYYKANYQYNKHDAFSMKYNIKGEVIQGLCLYEK